MGTKIRITLAWITSNWITPTQFPPTRQTSNRQINMIIQTGVHYKNWCHVIHMIHNPVHILREPYHATLLADRSYSVTLHLYFHQITHHFQKESHLQKILCHSTKIPNRYHTYQTTLIQTSVCHILLRHTNYTHQNMGVLNEDDIRVRNVGVKVVPEDYLKITPSLHPNHLKLGKIPGLWGLNQIRILYSARFIFWISWIHLKLFYHNLSGIAYCLWIIYP